MSSSEFNRNTPPELTSKFADDPEMSELIAFFSGELTQRVSAMQESIQNKDSEGLKRLAHQLKGAAGGYGYPTIGAAAAELDARLKTAPEGGLDTVQAEANALIELCRKASTPPTG